MIKQPCHQLATLLEWEVQINPSVAVRAVFSLKRSDELVHGLACLGEQLEQHHARSNAVSFGDVFGESNSSTLFDARKDVAPGHLGTDELEPHTRLSQG